MVDGRSNSRAAKLTTDSAAVFAVDRCDNGDACAGADWFEQYFGVYVVDNAFPSEARTGLPLGDGRKLESVAGI